MVTFCKYILNLIDKVGSKVPSDRVLFFILCASHGNKIIKTPRPHYTAMAVPTVNRFLKNLGL